MELVHYRSFIADSARWSLVELRPGDIVIATPSKSGTTWMQTLVALVLHDGWPEAAVQDLSPWVDMSLFEVEARRQQFAAMPDRRFFKTHTPLDGVPLHDEVTYIVVGRDPRDVVASMIDHDRRMDHGQAESMRSDAGVADEFTATAAEDREWNDDPVHTFLERPRNHSSSAVHLENITHTLGVAWGLRLAPNVALFHYGDLLDDLPGELNRLAATLDVDLAPQRLAELAAEASLDGMRARADETAPGGQHGIWKDPKDFFAAGRRRAGAGLFTDAQQERYAERLATLVADPALRAWIHDGRRATDLGTG